MLVFSALFLSCYYSDQAGCCAENGAALAMPLP
eukprot:SAG22_NODE_22413_length_199_cov_141.820000_1_plen_32_part_10